MTMPFNMVIADLMRKILLPLALLLVVAACRSTPALVGSTAVQVRGATELPSPTGIVNDPAADVYRIGPMDRLIIDVYGFETLAAREVQVDASGHISIPLGGTINIGGLSPREAEARITQQLRRNYVRDPQVSVNLRESGSRFVTIDGQVGQPGNYPVVNNMTLMRAVAAARGTNEFARLDEVVLFRTVQGQRMAALYDLAAIRRGQYEDPRVYPEDLIVVGSSEARRIFRDILNAAPILSGPLIAILQN
jgi:polysaccharide biosynthesis/export protein